MFNSHSHHEPLFDITSEEALSKPVPEKGFSTTRRSQILVHESPAMKACLATVLRLARTVRNPVLVSGEVGTEKEAVARAIHDNGPGRLEPFRVIDVRGTDARSLHGELFGAEGRRGVLQARDGGTVYLDGIDDAHRSIQTGLHDHIKKGGTGYPRLIVSSSTKLDQKQELGQFHAGLYFDLVAWEVRVPPLRDRPEDIPELVRRALTHLCAEEQLPVMKASSSLLGSLVRSRLPGNVIELESSVYRWMFIDRLEEQELRSLPQAA